MKEEQENRKRLRFKGSHVARAILSQASLLAWLLVVGNDEQIARAEQDLLRKFRALRKVRREIKTDHANSHTAN